MTGPPALPSEAANALGGASDRNIFLSFFRMESKYHALLRRTINEQLSYTPIKETRNRKPLEQPAPFDVTWELRCGPMNRFRVFYDVDASPGIVLVLAIGVKDGSRLLIGGEEFEQ